MGMTYEEAINLLYNLDGMIEDNHGSDYDAALRMAIEALGKQMPMGDDDTFECPRCKKVEFGYFRPKYCENCGQRIADWSE